MVSAGAVLYRRSEGDEKRLFLLLKYTKGHWGLVKGKIEPGEEDLETVRREAEEEAGITQMEFDTGFESGMEYDFTSKKYGHVQKKVRMYLAETDQTEIRLSHEHTDFEWMPYEKALDRITFPEAKKVFIEAVIYLEEHSGGGE